MISEKLKNKAIDYCKKALDEFYKKDRALFEVDVHERCMVFRIGLYLAKAIEKDDSLSEYYVDLEYNRIGSVPKEIETGRIIPDLQIHKRRIRDNLIVMEFKKEGNNTDEDQKKLISFTRQSGEYRYAAGLSIILGQECYKISVFENGKETRPLTKDIH